MLQSVLELTLTGLAYGAILFLIASGLSISMGLMRFANLAHGASVMFGGYVVVALLPLGVPFLLTLPLAFLACLVLGAVVERVLLHRFYDRPDQSQLLVTLGLVFVAIAVATKIWGAGQQPVDLPSWLTERVNLGLVDLSAYRLFVSASGLAIGLALIAMLERSFLGAQVRAAVDDRPVAESSGINVRLLFTMVFALSSGVAGLGGALSINMLGLDPSFPLRYLVVVLIVVAIGGPGSIRATLYASLMLGVIDSIAKYTMPATGSFAIYVVAAVVLFLRPHGLFIGARA